ELRRVFRVEVFLIAEHHRFEREERFARSLHWPDLILESPGTRRGSEFAVFVNKHGSSSSGSLSKNASDIAAVIDVLADSTDAINVISCGNVNTGARAQGDVVAAAGVVSERMITDGGVGDASCATNQCLKPTGGVDATSGVVLKRPLSGGRVSDADGVVMKRKIAHRRVVSPSSVGAERLIAKGVVARPALIRAKSESAECVVEVSRLMG